MSLLINASFGSLSSTSSAEAKISGCLPRCCRKNTTTEKTKDYIVLLCTDCGFIESPEDSGRLKCCVNDDFTITLRDKEKEIDFKELKTGSVQYKVRVPQDNNEPISIEELKHDCSFSKKIQWRMVGSRKTESLHRYITWRRSAFKDTNTYVLMDNEFFSHESREHLIIGIENGAQMYYVKMPKGTKYNGKYADLERYQNDSCENCTIS